MLMVVCKLTRILVIDFKIVGNPNEKPSPIFGNE